MHATNESPKQEMGLIKLSSERLAGLDARELATDLQQMASEAQQYVEEQRVFEQEQLGPWLEQLRQQ